MTIMLDKRVYGYIVWLSDYNEYGIIYDKEHDMPYVFTVSERKYRHIKLGNIANFDMIYDRGAGKAPRAKQINFKDDNAIHDPELLDELWRMARNKMKIITKEKKKQ